MPFKHFHSCRLKDPSQFDTFRYKKQDGSDLVLGRKGSGDWEVQAIRYPADSVGEAAAKASCTSHHGTFEPAAMAANYVATNFEQHVEFASNLPEGVMISWTDDSGIKTFSVWPASEQPPAVTVKTHAISLPNQEIFSTGTWNGDAYDEKDLDGIVEAFKSNAIGRPVPLKLGHDEAQKFFGQSSGAPALGWVENLRRAGSKLVADFVGVPEKIVELIKKKLYRGKSAEIYWNYPGAKGATWPRALKAVSLLGADLPAVTNLNELYASLMQDQLQFAKAYGETAKGNAYKTYDALEQPKSGGSTMDAAKEKQYQDEIAALQAKAKKEEERANSSDARAVKAEAALDERDEKHAVAQFTARIETLVKDGKILPPQKDGFVATFKALPITKTVDGKEVKPRDEFVASLEKLPKIVKFGSTSAGGEGTENQDEPPAVFVDKLAKKYMSEHKLSYSDAIGKVKQDHPEMWQSYLSNRRA